MIIKVCGMRDEHNIREMEQTGIDWMGFIFYSKSPRYVGDTLPYLPENLLKVGVFVNEPVSRMLDVAQRNRLDILQLHGDESPEMCHDLQQQGYKVMKAFGIKNDVPFPSEVTERYEECCDYFLFDTGTPVYGGSGKKFAWEKLQNYQGNTPFLLSGGIAPDDERLLQQFSHPLWKGIDLNSGFEIAPALKDVAVLGPFVAQVRSLFMEK